MSKSVLISSEQCTNIYDLDFIYTLSVFYDKRVALLIVIQIIVKMCY